MREAREAAGLSYADVARRAGVARQAVQLWEQRGIGTLRALEKAARALRVSEAWLAYAAGPRGRS